MEDIYTRNVEIRESAMCNLQKMFSQLCTKNEQIKIWQKNAAPKKSQKKDKKILEKWNSIMFAD